MTFFVPKFTANRWPTPFGRSLILDEVLSNLDPGSAVSVTLDGGVRGVSLTTKGVWANAENISVTTLGMLAYLETLGNVENSVVFTEHAPLTKGWGDAQLATVNDVSVTVNGQPVGVVAIEPVMGILVLDRVVTPGLEVLVDYHWTQNPTLEMGLNSPSYPLNHYNSTGMPFTYNAVLPPFRRRQPSQYEHRYRAFDYPYTAVTNDPTSMLLNEPRHSLVLPKFRRQINDLAIFFEGSDHPTAEGFEYVGGTLGPVQIDGGMYVIEDTSASTDIATGAPAFFQRVVDLTPEYNAILNFRLRLTNWAKNGDFTGVAAGYSDDEHLYMLGFLEIGSFKTASLLENPYDESAYTSWASVRGNAISRDVGGTPTVDVLEFTSEPPLMAGQRIYSEGTVYTALAVTPSSLDHWEVVFDTPFPATGPLNFMPEVDFTVEQTYRIFKTTTGQLNLYVGGSAIPMVSTSDPAPAVEVFETTLNQTLFFGSVDRKATNRSLWDFARYSLLPVRNVQQDSLVSVKAEFNSLPEDDPNDPWYLSDNQGFRANFGHDVLLTQSAGAPLAGGSTNYTRVEPFLTSKAKVDLTARLRVSSWAVGLPAILTIADDQKELTLGFFDRQGTISSQKLRDLVGTGFLPRIDPLSLSVRKHLEGYNTPQPGQFLHAYGGTQSFANDAWVDTLDPAELSFYDHFMRIEHNGGTATATQTGIGAFSDTIVAARIRIGTYATQGLGRLPVHWGIDDGNTEVFLTFFDDGISKKVVFAHADGTLALNAGSEQGVDFPWDDGEFHQYRIARVGTNITIFIDGVYRGLFDANDLKPSASTDATTLFGLSNGQVDVDLDYFFAHSAQHDPRKVGVYRGGDILDPDNYDFVAEEWFGTWLDLRVARDPTGATEVFLNGTSRFSYQYSELPRKKARYNVETGLGFIQFGTLDPQAYSEVQWDYVRYNIVNQRERQRANNNSYLNRHNVISSPESIIDDGPEVVTLNASTPNLVRLSETQMWARQILSVTSQDGLTIYPFAYDFDTNEIAITGAGLPSDTEPVTVTFFHRKPYTEAYLENNFAFTRLNEGTPIVPLRQQVDLTAEEGFLSQINDPDDLLNIDPDFTLNDGQRVIHFGKNDWAWYEGLKVLTVQTGDDGLISPACDENGLKILTFEGPFATDANSLPEQGDEWTDHNYRILYFNNPTRRMNTPEASLALITSPVSLGYAQTFSEGPMLAATDALGPAVIQDFYGSGLFNTPLATLNTTAPVVTTTYDAAAPFMFNVLFSKDTNLGFSGEYPDTSDTTLQIALQSDPGSDIRHPGETYEAIVSVLTGAGHVVTQVQASDIATMEDISAFDVVILYGGSDMGEYQSELPILEPIIASYVASGGSVLFSGYTLWHIRDLEASPHFETYPNLRSISPQLVGTSSSMQTGGDVTLQTHPITAGIQDFSIVSTDDVYNGALKPGATLLSQIDGIDDSSVWQYNAGRVAHLGPVFTADDATFDSLELLDNSIPDAVALFLNTIEWLGGNI